MAKQGLEMRPLGAEAAFGLSPEFRQNFAHAAHQRRVKPHALRFGEPFLEFGEATLESVEALLREFGLGLEMRGGI